MLQNLSLRQRIMALALLPTLTISLLLGTTFTLTRLQDLEQGLHDRASLISEQLAPLAAQVLAQNHPELELQILRRALEQPDVRAATLYNEKGLEIGHSGPKMLAEDAAAERGLTEEIHFLDEGESFRILRPLVNYSGFFLERIAQPHQLRSLDRERIGWLELEFSRDNNQVKTYQTFLASGLLIQAGILLNLLLALALGRKITQPIQQLLSSIKTVRDGDLEHQLPVHGRGEFAELTRDINTIMETMKQARQELVLNIDQTTADLQETLESLEVNNVELDLARRRAQQASQTKSEFLANMSHELRTPLNSMIGFTRLLQRSELSEHQQDYLATIRSSAEGLLAMLNSILDFSKLEAGKLELDHNPFNLRELVEQVLILLGPSAHEKNLELISLIYSDVPLELESDPLRLKQILTNLVSNAIKFTDSGHICVRIMLESEQGAKSLIKVSVTDTGVGLTTAQIKQLFHAFAQADPSRTRRLGGTGLGLVISKGLVEMLKGEIGVDSELGEGTTFWFSFWANAAVDQVGPQPIQLNDCNTLLFEPNELAQTSYQHLFGLHQLKVQTCKELSQLYHELQVQEQPIDLVVLSYHPHTVSTTQIEQFLTAIEQQGGHLIVLCGAKDEFVLERLLAEHPRAICLVKPLSLTHLNRALGQLLPPAEPTTAYSPSTLIQQQAALHNLSTITTAPQILAVDDNPANLKLVRILLEELGLRVDTATGGQHALDLANQQRYDLILLDIQMPDIDGLAVTQVLREREGPNQNSPIIALTAHALAGEKQQLLLAGMNAYLTKPVDERQLKQVIEQWTGQPLRPVAQQPKPATSLQPKAPQQPVLVDIGEGQRLAGGKADLADELLQMLLTSLPTELQEISQALSNRDQTTLLEQVHKLHGATRYCGVPRLRKACQNAEEHLKNSSSSAGIPTQQIQPLLTEIQALIDWTQNQAPTASR